MNKSPLRGIVRLLKMYPAFWRAKKEFIHQVELKQEAFLFFPGHVIGGAERVHINIIRAIAEIKPVCFMEKHSGRDDFFNEFDYYTTLLFLDDICTLGGKARRLHIRFLADKISERRNPVVFGWSSAFFYDLIPFLAKHVKVIDIIHAIEDSGTWRSLPIVEKISQRVILGQVAKQKFVNLYDVNGLKPELINRFLIIPNAVMCPSNLAINPQVKKLSVIYVGRNSPEKRIRLFNNIASNCFDRGVPATFSVVGDMSTESSEEFTWLADVQLLGAKTTANDLNICYDAADLILLTSEREGLPMVVIEGMAHGVVPICTNVGELSAHIGADKKNGILISALDESEIVDQFVEQIARFAEDREELRAFAAEAYEYTKEHFSMEKFNMAYRALLAPDHSFKEGDK